MSVINLSDKRNEKAERQRSDKVRKRGDELQWFIETTEFLTDEMYRHDAALRSATSQEEREAILIEVGNVRELAAKLMNGRSLASG